MSLLCSWSKPPQCVDFWNRRFVMQCRTESDLRPYLIYDRVCATSKRVLRVRNYANNSENCATLLWRVSIRVLNYPPTFKSCVGANTPSSICKSNRARQHSAARDLTAGQSNAILCCMFFQSAASRRRPNEFAVAATALITTRKKNSADVRFITRRKRP